jgi:hypothetical protein
MPISSLIPNYPLTKKYKLMKTNPSIFSVFQHSDEYFEILSDSNFSKKYIVNQLLVILLFTFIYGIIMGSFNGFYQSLVTGIKIPCLIFLSLLICFPAFYVIQYLIGSTMTIIQMTNIILSGFVVFSTIALSFAPIVVFFMITSNNYPFLKLLHVAIFIFSGIFAVRTIINGLSFSCEKKNIYPKIGMNIFKSWVIILAFVSSQLAWNLRPFVGSRDLPFELFRVRKGNFYIAVIRSVSELFRPESDSKQNVPLETDELQTDSTTNDSNE